MKIRNGFVSNSSSSSFVLIGKRVTEDEVKIAFNYTDEDLDDLFQILDSRGFTWYSEEGIIGILLSEIDQDSYTMDENEIDFTDLTQKVNTLSTTFKCKKSDIKLLTGTVSC